MFNRKPALETGSMEFERCGYLPGREEPTKYVMESTMGIVGSSVLGA